VTTRRDRNDAGLSIAEGFAGLGLHPAQVWTEYLVLGGVADRREVEDALLGHRHLGEREHNRLAAALNEHYVDAGQDHPVAYLDPPRWPGTGAG
jgi:hypothetical protein